MSRRLPAGGRVDRARSLRFRFDDADYEGLQGDTLASALLANGVDVVARSVHRGRPRGVFSAGAEEPNALVQVELAGGSEPLRAATTIELVDGLAAWSLPARGRAERPAASARYDKADVHCDVLVIGGGPAGLAAADAAAGTDARVILVDEGSELGGSLLAACEEIAGGPALDWVAGVAERLAAAPETRVLTRASAVGYYDGNYVTVAERRTDHLGAAAPAGVSRERLWHVRARRVVLATGAYERPLVFAGNDLPGVMLAGAARAYVERFAVAPGRTAVLAAANDGAYAAAAALADAGVALAAIVDCRPAPGRAAAEDASRRGIEVLAGHVVARARGGERVERVEIRPLRGEGEARELACDLLAVSGGWSPATQLFGQSGGTLRWDERRVCFVPDRGAQAQRSAGACAGTFGLASCLAEGAAAGAEAAALAGFRAEPAGSVSAPSRDEAPPAALWLVPGAEEDADLQFLDLQRDATVADVERAVAAGMRSPEHVKRFTTIGTGADQGRTSAVLTLGVLAQRTGVDLAALAPTSARPPAIPVSFALLAGRDRGELHDPIRVTPVHAWHAAHGAVFENVGQWHRARHYPREGEDMDAAVLRECRAAREAVAIMDASTLGKIDLQGPDSAELLNRLYTGDLSKLAVGMAKYVVICRPDGMVFDDGVAMRLAEDRFLVTTTTGNAAAVLDWYEEWLQGEWPYLKVRATSVTEQWATVAVVGPRSRDVLAALAPGIALENEAFPFMAIREGEVAGIAARVCRVSFSGELSFEVNVAAWHGLALWEALIEAGAPHGIAPYGTEGMHVLRAEKGYFIVGQETDGTTTPLDLGLQWMIAKAKGDFVGKRSFTRADTARPDRKQLVGLLPDDPAERLPEGAQIVLDPAAAKPVPMVGHVTSSYASAALGRTFALAMLAGGRERLGETVHVPLLDGRVVSATVADPVFYDKEEARRDG